MPTFCSSSAVRTSTGQFSLSLRARHILVAGDPSDTVRTVKGRLPEGVDVILDSDLVITLSGLVDAVKVPGHVIQRSAVARHVLDHLRTNAGQLGLGAISKLYVDEDDGRAKFSLSSSRPLRATTEMACFRLVSIDVVLSCRMIVRGGESSPEAASLFSGQAYLPLSSALDSVLEKFIANDLVRRYPLIFGPWREKLDLEARVFPSLSRSLMDVARSSSDPSFKKRFQRLVATLGTRHASRVRCVNQAVRDCLGDNAVDEAHRPVIQEGFDILKRSLDTLFRRGVRPATFKALSATTQGAYDEDEDDYMFDLSEGASNRDVIIPWPGSSDEDLIELDSGEDNDEPWVTADCSLFLDETGCPEEDDSDCIVLSDEESGHQGLPRSHNSTSLDCGALVLASRTALLVADAGEEDETWLPQSNGHALLASSRGTQSLGSDDDAITFSVCDTGLDVWSTPDHSQHCKNQVTDTLEAACGDPDLLLDWCDDDVILSDDAMSPSKKDRHGAWLSTTRSGCGDSDAVETDDDSDDCLFGDDSDDIYLAEPSATLTTRHRLESPYGSELPHLSFCDIRRSGLGSGHRSSGTPL